MLDIKILSISVPCNWKHPYGNYGEICCTLHLQCRGYILKAV